MPKPSECPDKLYNEIMLKCWHANPNKRPTFEHLFEILEDFNIATESSYNDDHLPSNLSLSPIGSNSIPQQMSVRIE